MRLLRWCAGFFEEGPKQSSARLCAILFAAAASYRLVVIREPTSWESLIQTAVIGGGCVALLLRKSGTE